MEYKVKLDRIYEGPIAYLYELVKASKIDIYDIPIAEITEQFLNYIRYLRSLDIEVSAEFILMASKLMYIKSRLLLPPVGKDPDEEKEDPRREIIDQLLEYHKFKQAVHYLHEKDVAQGDLIFREKKQYIFDYNDEQNWVDISIFDLIAAFSKIVEYIDEPRFGDLGAEEVTVAMKINDIQDRLDRSDRFYFGELFSEKVSRYEVVVTFLAILELVKISLIRIQQHRMFGDIRIIRKGV